MPVFPESTRRCAHVWRSIPASKGLQRLNQTTKSHEGDFFSSSSSLFLLQKRIILTGCKFQRQLADEPRLICEIFTCWPCRGKLGLFRKRFRYFGRARSAWSHNSKLLRVGTSACRKVTLETLQKECQPIYQLKTPIETKHICVFSMQILNNNKKNGDKPKSVASDTCAGHKHGTKTCFVS